MEWYLTEVKCRRTGAKILVRSLWEPDRARSQGEEKAPTTSSPSLCYVPPHFRLLCFWTGWDCQPWTGQSPPRSTAIKAPFGNHKQDSPSLPWFSLLPYCVVTQQVLWKKWPKGASKILYFCWSYEKMWTCSLKKSYGQFRRVKKKSILPDIFVSIKHTRTSYPYSNDHCPSPTQVQMTWLQIRSPWVQGIRSLSPKGKYWWLLKYL